jgi:hypothetical protein
MMDSSSHKGSKEVILDVLCRHLEIVRLFMIVLGVALPLCWLKKEVIVLALRSAWFILVAALRELSFS